MSKRNRDGAGTIMIVQDKVLLLQRNDRSSYPGTWAPPGGMIEKGETPFSAAVRETGEETSINIGFLRTTDVFTQPRDEGGGMYTTYIYDVPSEYTTDDFNVRIDHESKGWGWFTVEDMRSMNLHPGVYNLLEYIGMEI